MEELNDVVIGGLEKVITGSTAGVPVGGYFVGKGTDMWKQIKERRRQREYEELMEDKEIEEFRRKVYRSMVGIEAFKRRMALANELIKDMLGQEGEGFYLPDEMKLAQKLLKYYKEKLIGERKDNFYSELREIAKMGLEGFPDTSSNEEDSSEEESNEEDSSE